VDFSAPMPTRMGGDILQVLRPVWYPSLSIPVCATSCLVLRTELSVTFSGTPTGASLSPGPHKAWHPCARPFPPPPPVTRLPTAHTHISNFYASHTSIRVRDSLDLSPRHSRHNEWPSSRFVLKLGPPSGPFPAYHFQG